MTDAWERGIRDASARSPLQAGEHRGPGGNQGERRDRYISVGISHPSNDPGRHRVFEILASYDEATGGWVARVGEQNPNGQLQGWASGPRDGDQARTFPTPAACLGAAVAAVVAMVDGEAANPS